MKRLIVLIFMIMILAGCGTSCPLISETNKTYFITNKIEVYSRYQTEPAHFCYYVSDGDRKFGLYSDNSFYEIGDVVRITVEPRISKVVK